eukprot:scaffold17198_cov119-Isochrysis_galbana.AAC.6
MARSNATTTTTAFSAAQQPDRLSAGASAGKSRGNIPRGLCSAEPKRMLARSEIGGAGTTVSGTAALRVPATGSDSSSRGMGSESAAGECKSESRRGAGEAVLERCSRAADWYVWGRGTHPRVVGKPPSRGLRAPGSSAPFATAPLASIQPESPAAISAKCTRTDGVEARTAAHAAEAHDRFLGSARAAMLACASPCGVSMSVFEHEGEYYAQREEADASGRHHLGRHVQQWWGDIGSAAATGVVGPAKHGIGAGRQQSGGVLALRDDEVQLHRSHQDEDHERVDKRPLAERLEHGEQPATQFDVGPDARVEGDEERERVSLSARAPEAEDGLGKRELERVHRRQRCARQMNGGPDDRAGVDVGDEEDADVEHKQGRDAADERRRKESCKRGRRAGRPA